MFAVDDGHMKFFGRGSQQKSEDDASKEGVVIYWRVTKNKFTNVLDWFVAKFLQIKP